MSKENDCYQSQLSARATDKLPFVDELAVKEVVRLVLEGCNEKQDEIVYPFGLSGREVAMVREHFERHHRKLAPRLMILTGVSRLSDGVGTVIEIRRKGGG